MDSLIELNGISKRFGNEYEDKILTDITLSIKEGEFISVVGKSGSGKSTLLRIMGLLINEFDGEYLYDSRNTADLDDKERAQIRNQEFGFVMQDYALIEDYKASENIMLPRRLSGQKLFGKKEDMQHIVNTAAELDVLHVLDKPTRILSGGEKQRIAIARAIINDPKIIFADEPTGALDTKTGKAVYDILKKLNNAGKTIVMVTHDRPLAAKANKIIEIRDGMIKTA